MKTLRARDANLHPTIEQLYERTIDFGAHPNELAVAGSMEVREGPGRRLFEQKYLDGDSKALDHVIKTTAQASVVSASLDTSSASGLIFLAFLLSLMT